MVIRNRLLQAAAGNATGGAGLDIDEVFSTYLYTGTGSTQTITNGIDLDGEGGLVWFKHRAGDGFGGSHWLIDTERGGTKFLQSQSTGAQSGNQNYISAFNVNGFTIGTGDAETNYSSGNSTYASWTFRKAPKFFDVVTYTGDGVAGRTISHNLGSAPGMVVIKRTDTGNDPYNSWRVAHIEGNTLTALDLDTTSDASSTPWLLWSDSSTATSAYAASGQTDAHFTVGSHASVNGSGGQFVAYIFAHNDGDGGFGPDGDQDIIKCGTYEGNDSDSTEININLGFEPQWLLIKNADLSRSWTIVDVMRGCIYGPAGSGSGTTDRSLSPNLADSEETCSSSSVITRVDPTPTGFAIRGKSSICNEFGTHIYMAIRRGPLAPPEDATEVFDVVTRTDSGSNTQHTVGFAPDVVLDMSRPLYSFNFVYDRLRGGKKYLATNATSAEGTFDYITFDDETGKFTTKTQTSGGITFVDYVWKRAPGYFDVVAYTGTNVAGLTINHNLGVVPEMMWVKNRSASEYWAVYHKDLNGGTNPSHYFLRLNTTDVETDYNEIWNDTEPTATQFTVGQQGVVNGSGTNHIAYLFASLPGISKVGSYSGNGSSQNIDCGFTSGARFILVKRKDSTGDWYFWDTARGIVAGNDPHLSLNTTAAQVTSDDSVDPDNSGFIVNQVAATNINVSSASYIFYAIA
jgi:hypothetical protein